MLHEISNLDLPWDAFITLCIFIPTIVGLLWEFSSPGVKRIWERLLFKDNTESYKFLFWISVFIVILLGFAFLSYYYFLDRPINTLLWLLVLDYLLVVIIFAISRLHFVLRMIQWRLRWILHDNFDAVFDRSIRRLRIAGRESRGGEETTLILKTMYRITYNILYPKSSKNSQKGYQGGELAILVESVTNILLDSPHNPTPDNIREAEKIFRLIVRRFQSNSLEENKDLQTVARNVSRLGRYIIHNLSLVDYERELLSLTQILIRCSKARNRGSQALREVALALLDVTSTQSFLTTHTLPIMALRGIEYLINTDFPPEENKKTQEILKAQQEIFYDYLTVLAALYHKGGSAAIFARELWEKARSALLQRYQQINHSSDEENLWQEAYTHHYGSNRFHLADLVTEMYEALYSSPH